MMISTEYLRRASLLGVLTLVACGGESSGTAKEVVSAESAGAERVAAAGARDVVVLDTTAIRLGGIQLGTADTISSTDLRVTGTITYDGNRVSHVGSRTEGRVVELPVTLGARVRRGQVLVELESPQVGQLRAEEKEADALLKIARENFAREQRLEQQGISSRKELLVAESELRRGEASLESAQSQLQVLGAEVHGTGGHFDISAPFAGIVVLRNVSLGEMAAPVDTLLTIADLSRVWIELDVFERDLSAVRIGQPVEVTVTAYPERRFPGRIVYIGDVLDPARRTARARVEVPNAEGTLKPGMFATANIRISSGARALVVVPQEAVQEVEKKQVVFVPGDAPGEYRTRVVEVGEIIGGNRVVIRSGLSVGERLVVAGAFALRSELAKGEIGDGEH